MSIHTMNLPLMDQPAEEFASVSYSTMNIMMRLDNDKFTSYLWGSISSMELRNADEDQAFYQFSVSRNSLRTVTLSSVLIGIFGILYYSFSLLHAKSRTVIAATLFLTIMIRYPLLIFLWKLKSAQKGGNLSNFFQSTLPYVSTMENILAICSSFSVGICLIARSLNGECLSLNQYYIYGCNSELASRSLPQEHLILLMLLPILYSVVYKAIKWRYVCLTWLMVIICISISIGVSNATNSIACLIIYMPISMLILYENHRQNLILFFVTQKQQKLLEENRVLSENAQNELRHIIANVAHDLKTVSHAWVSNHFREFIILFSLCVFSLSQHP